MGYKKCPKCGSTNCELTAVGKHHGIIWFILFGIVWFIYAICKWVVGICVAVCFDWWMAIVKAIQKKAYYWRCKKWFMKRSNYYCHDCGYNFKA